MLSVVWRPLSVAVCVAVLAGACVPGPVQDPNYRPCQPVNEVNGDPESPNILRQYPFPFSMRVDANALRSGDFRLNGWGSLVADSVFHVLINPLVTLEPVDSDLSDPLPRPDMLLLDSTVFENGDNPGCWGTYSFASSRTERPSPDGGTVVETSDAILTRELVEGWLPQNQWIVIKTVPVRKLRLALENAVSQLPRVSYVADVQRAYSPFLHAAGFRYRADRALPAQKVGSAETICCEYEGNRITGMALTNFANGDDTLVMFDDPSGLNGYVLPETELITVAMNSQLAGALLPEDRYSPDAFFETATGGPYINRYNDFITLIDEDSANNEPVITLGDVRIEGQVPNILELFLRGFSALGQPEPPTTDLRFRLD